MRFKNLTITLTLSVLSMVAVTGLVLLPIADVISCSDNDRQWNKAADNRSKSFSAFHKYPDPLNNLGWSVSAGVNVSVASAFASTYPSIVDPDRIVGLWEVDKTKTSHTFYGNATVMAAVYPASVEYANLADHENTPYPHTSLSANVQIKTQRYAVCKLRSKSSSTTKEMKFEISVQGAIPTAFVNIQGTTSYQYTDTQGTVWSVSVTGETTESIHGLGQVIDKTSSKTGGSDWSLAYARVTSFSMVGCSFPSGQVSLSKDDCTVLELAMHAFATQ